MVRLSCALFSALLCLLPAATHAQFDPPNPILIPPAPLHEQVLRLPGDPDRPVSLEVTLYEPDGSAKLPLAVLNHGATDIGDGNRGTRYRYTFSAYYFLSRGYAVAMPMARGFAESGGSLEHDGCDLAEVGRENANDLRAVIDALRQRPEIDGERIVVEGQSFGGWTTMALGSQDVPGLRGLIGFSPALRTSDCRWQDQAMIAGARRFGAGARYPALWFYGHNDSVMPTATWHAVYAAYAAGNKQSTLVDVGEFMEDSHQLLSFSESLPIWTPRVDAFLRAIGLPYANRFPAYLPTPVPPASHFAALADVAAVPGLNDKGRAEYERFLEHHVPRVFFLAPNGGFGATFGGFDPLARGLAECRAAGLSCVPYAIDSDVVWTGGAAAPRDYARTVPAGATALLNFAYAVNPDCSSKGLPTLKVSEAPKHGETAVLTHAGHPGFPPGSRYAACDTAMVPGVSLTYTPAPGFTGADVLTFEETDVEGGHHAYRIDLTVR